MKKKLDRIFTAITFLCVSLICVIGLGYGLQASGVTKENFVTKLFKKDSTVTAAVPTRSKSIKDLGNGTYELSLSVVGDAIKKQNHVNVVVIVDTSGSMKEKTGNSEVTYTPTNGDGYYLYGLVNGEYVPLTMHSEGGRWNRTYYYTYNDGYYSEGPRYTGQRYIRDEANQTRMEAAKKAVNGLAEILLNKNGAKDEVTGEVNDNDVVEMSLVSFATTATSKSVTTKYDTFSGYVNALNANGGTNWEAALIEAAKVDFNDDDPTFVIFVTDGAPTFHATDGGYDNWNRTYQAYGNGQEEKTNMERSYTQAVDDAKGIVDSVGAANFFTIFAYGETFGSTYLTNLTTAAGGQASNNYSVENTASLQEAFNSILGAIEMAGIGDVEVIDGTTSKVATSTGIAKLLTIDDKSFKYFKGGVEWPDAPKAKIKDGTVVWDLGEAVLDNAVEYKVTFNVWPSQETLDTIADLKNGNTKYEELDENVQLYLSEDYKLATNTTAKLKYADTRVDNTIREVGIDNPPSVKTDSYKLKVEKLWENGLDSKTQDGVSTVTLNVFRDNDQVDSIVMNQAITGWSGSTYIAPGMISNKNGKVEILEAGHDYSLAEPENLSYHWELTSAVVHPMIINGNVTKLILVDDVTITDGNYLEKDGKEYYKINDKVYVVGDSDTALTATNSRRSYFELTKVVNGENVPEDAKFTYQVKINNSMADLTDEEKTSDDEIWFSVLADPSNKDSIVKNLVTSAQAEIKDGESTGYYYVPSGKAFTVQLEAGWNFRIINLPTGSSYEVEETEMPNGFVFESINALGTKTNKKVTGTIDSANTAYQVTYTNKYVLTDVVVTKKWEDANNQDGIRPTELALVLKADGNVVTNVEPEIVKNGNTWTYSYKNLNKFNGNNEIVYTVEEGSVGGYSASNSGVANKANGYTITNSHTPATVDVTVKKVWNDKNNQDGIQPANIDVKLSDGTVKNLNAENNWTVTVEGLPKFSEGKEIKYTWTEENVPEGYELTGNETVNNVTTLTNTHKTYTVDLTVVKKWEDKDNQDGKRPAVLHVDLMNGNTKVRTVELTEENKWTATVEDLQLNANGQAISYSWVEEDIGNNYKLTDTKVDKNVTTLTNTRETETTIATVVKVWEDKNNQDGIQPESVDVKLSNGTVKTLNAKNNWTATVEGLPKYSGGKEIKYTWTEENVPSGYKVTGNVTTGAVTTITNSHTPATVDVTVKKVWNDKNNQDGIQPGSVDVKLSNGTVVTLDAANKWTATVEGLPKFSEGKEIKYTWTEENVPSGYKLTGNETVNNVTTLTNTHETYTTSVEVSKKWNDGGNRDLTRPPSITVRLMNGNTEVANRVMSEDNGWSYKFDNLPLNNGGKAINYTVTEDPVAGYRTSITGSMSKGYEIENSYDPATTSVTVRKVWDDKNNQDNIQPTSVIVTLKGDGEYVDAAEVTGPNWTYTFNGLAKNKAGKAIAYTVEEDAVAGYTPNITGDAATGFVITNTHEVEKTTISGKKTWSDNDNQDGIRPGKIVVNLMNGTTKVDSTEVTGPEWTYTFTADKNSAGQAINYTIVEEAVAGYTPSYDGYNITNTHESSVISVTATKSWNDNNDNDGKRPEDVTFNLVVGDEVIDSDTANVDNNWTVTFEGLAEFKEGNAINYTITEDEEENYTSKVTGSIKEGFVVTNTHEDETTDVSVSKKWEDKDNQDGKRTSAVTVNLLADGTKVDSVVLSDENKWSHTFEDLAKYNAKKEIVYTVVEEEVEGYLAKVTGDATNGYLITNNYDPEKTQVVVTKTWEDKNNQDGIRPDKITVKLFADGEELKEGTLTAEAGWTYTFDELDKYKDQGTEIVYTISEVEVEGYESKLDGYTITNTHETEKVDVIGTVIWDDENNKDELRPDEVEICVYGNGEKVECKTVSSNDKTYEFNDLPKNKDGEEINYTVTEKDINEYEITINKYDITNKHVPEDGDVLGEKEEQKPEEPKKDEGDVLPAKKDNDNPETGDTILPFALLLLTSLSGISITAKKIVDREK